MMGALKNPLLSFAELYNVGKNALPEPLQSRFLPSAGFCLGLEFRDSFLQVNPKSEKQIRQGMVLCISVGLSSTEKDPWALWITDTIAILPGQAPADGGPVPNVVVEMTQGCKKEEKEVIFDFTDSTSAGATVSAVAAGATKNMAAIGGPGGASASLGAAGGVGGNVALGTGAGMMMGNGATASSSSAGMPPPSAGAFGGAAALGLGGAKGGATVISGKQQQQAALLQQQQLRMLQLQAKQGKGGKMPMLNPLGMKGGVPPGVPGGISGASSSNAAAGDSALNLQLRGARSQRACAAHMSQHMNVNAEQMARQKELREKKTAELAQRFRRGYKDADDAAGGGQSGAKKKRMDIQVYRTAGELPDFSSIGNGKQKIDLFKQPRVLLDETRMALLCPINGIFVPFGIKVIKSITVSQDELERYVLRVVFYTPGGGGSTYEDYPEMPEEWITTQKAARDRQIQAQEGTSELTNEQGGGAGTTTEGGASSSSGKKLKSPNRTTKKGAKASLGSEQDSEDEEEDAWIPRRLFIKELTFKSVDSGNFESLALRFKEAQKAQRGREQEEEAQQGLVEQEPVQVLYQRTPPCLRDIHVRPILTSRKAVGRLESHRNGLKFIAQRNESLDILYKNIRHAVFEPCVDSVNTVLHFQLKNEVIINKKRTRMVQFFCEVLNTTEDLTNGRRQAGDERMEDERERILVNRINQAFRQFINNTWNLMKEDGTPLTFEYPYQNLKFQGVHHRASVAIMPTVHCFVALQEWPAFCLPYKDIELAVFERFTMDLKEFDLIFILKDYQKPVVKISAIPNREYGERLKQIFTQNGLVYYTYEQQMKWTEVMKEAISTIRTGEFQTTGCWETWFGGDADAGAAAEEDSDETDSASEFKPDSEDDDDEEFDPASEDEDEEESEYQENSDDDSDSSAIDLEDIPDSDDERPASRRPAASRSNQASASSKAKSTKVGVIGGKGAGKGAASSASRAGPRAANPVLKPRAVPQPGSTIAQPQQAYQRKKPNASTRAFK
ncbi:unnamed protein product [Amoebophrya sp. A25]|nr:unnamed protein product [Amoebophrya sp. A25]|eukprot:GSA25T00014110001.1